MGLSKQEKLKIKQEYNKEWNNYLKRLRSAESKGIVIPESLIFTKVKNPTERSIERLKKANFKTFKKQSTANYVNQYGDIVSKDEAVTTAQKPKFKPWLGSTVRERNRIQQESAPVTFDEYIKIAEETAGIRQKYDLSDPNQKAAYDDIILNRVRDIRGPFFDEELFIANEEKTHGYFGRDANEPLNQAERDYIRRKLRERDIDEDDEYSYQKEVEKLRSPLSNYEPEIQMYHEERADFPAFADEDLYPQDTQFDREDDWSYHLLDEQPEEAPYDNKTAISSEVYETYAYNALYSMVSELIFKSKFADRNREYMLRQMERWAASYDPRPLNQAIEILAGQNAELFDVTLFYKTGALSQYLYKIERLIIKLSTAKDADWEDAASDEAEANFNESQEQIDEIEV